MGWTCDWDVGNKCVCNFGGEISWMVVVLNKYMRDKVKLSLCLTKYMP